MNKFLQSLVITFRRDPTRTNFRLRVNKLNSFKDKEQKGPCSIDVLRVPLDGLLFSIGKLEEFLFWPLRRRSMYDGMDVCTAPWRRLTCVPGPRGRCGYEGWITLHVT